jgi:trehalose 6-phosphate phosphatase
MKVLKKDIHLEKFFDRLRIARHRALLLDYDGTLAPFRTERDEARPYPGVRELLNEILELNSVRVVLISGRATKDLLPLLNLNRLPEIWGSHGWERLMPDGTCETLELDESAQRSLAEAYYWIQAEELVNHCERKPVGLTLHWRGLPDEDASEIRTKASERWSSLAKNTGLGLYEFDGGIELRMSGRDKGDAVATIFSEMGEGTVIAYLGDDLTDEDAFQALKCKGLSVLVRPDFRPTAADLWLRPPEELLDFLRNWQRACKEHL